MYVTYFFAAVVVYFIIFRQGRKSIKDLARPALIAASVENVGQFEIFTNISVLNPYSP